MAHAASHAERLEDPVDRAGSRGRRPEVPASSAHEPTVQLEPCRDGALRSVRPRPCLGRADRAERAARLRPRLVPFGGRVAPPGDAATDVERQPSTVGDERPDEDASSPSRRRRSSRAPPRVRAAPDRLERLEDLHRPDLGRPVIEPPGKRRREEVERVAAGGEAPGHRRDEVLDRRRPLEPAQPRDADAPRPADAPEVVAQDVHDHHVLGAVLGPTRGARAARARSSARVRPRGRVPLIGSVRTRPAASSARNGSGEADRIARGRRCRPARGRGTRRRPPGRRPAGAGRGATGRRRRGSRAAGSGWPGRARPGDRCPDRLDPAIQVDDRAPGGRQAREGRLAAGRHPTAASARARTPASARARPAASPSTARPASQARPSRRSQAIAQSCRASRRSGSPWSSIARAGRRSRRRPRSYAEEPDEPAGERRGVRRQRRPSRRARAARATANGSRPRRPSRTATGSAVRNDQRPAGPDARSRAGPGPAGRGTPPPRRPAESRRSAGRRSRSGAPGRRGHGRIIRAGGRSRGGLAARGSGGGRASGSAANRP